MTKLHSRLKKQELELVRLSIRKTKKNNIVDEKITGIRTGFR